MAAYYNEHDRYAAQWLRNLVAAGHIAAGDVDERSIVDVRPDDLRPYRQCHFFAGIGGWSLALRLAGWPDDGPVWTGSCPCQPFSAAGAGTAADDERHLWPAWFPLIRELRPARIFGEQVEAAIGWGWLDVVLADLESQGYACGTAVLPACSVGAPHIRQRSWFVAHHHEGRRKIVSAPRLHDRGQSGNDADRCGIVDVGDADEPGSQGRRIDLGKHADQWSPWSASHWLPCTDGKARPVEPGTFPLAHGIPGRVGRLRAYGNAIVPQVAAEFIRAAINA